jgi:hypothetical protein
MINPLSIPTSAVQSLVFKLNKRSTFANTAAAKIGASLASIILTQRLLSSIVGLGRILTSDFYGVLRQVIIKSPAV